MKKEQILDKAKELISNERLKHYGPPKENFARIAKIWTAILGTEIRPSHVALCMIGLKIARLQETPNHDDSWIDLAGYAACGSEVSCTSGEVQSLASAVTNSLFYKDTVENSLFYKDAAKQTNVKGYTRHGE